MSGRVSGRVSGLASRLVPAGAHAVHADAAQGEDTDEHCRAHDGDVSDIADEQTEVVDEVDDVPASRTGLAGHPVGEVAHRAAEEQAEGPGPTAATDAARRADDEDEHPERDEGEHPGRAVGDGERGSGVADQVEPDELAEDVHRLTGLQGPQRQDLGQLVGDVDHHGGQHQETEQSAAVSAGVGGGGGLVGRGQRRSCFVLHVTHRVARGAA